jgi:alpha-glucuronidase
MKSILALLLFVFGLVESSLRAEDGYRLWLRYEPLPAKQVTAYQPQVVAVMAPGSSATAVAIRQELVAGGSALLGRSVPAVNELDRNGLIVVGTPKNTPAIAELPWSAALARLGPEGFLIRSVKLRGHATTVIAATTEVGALYGAFHFLRLLQTSQPIDALNVSEKPALGLRVLNHWDNLDGSIERGYAGRSLWDWNALHEPERRSPDRLGAELAPQRADLVIGAPPPHGGGYQREVLRQARSAL